MRACLRFAAILPLALAAAPAVAQNVVDLVCEYKESPLGIDVTSPRLSWKVNTTEPDWMQSAYRIQVASSSADLSAENRLLWDSGKVLETASVHRVYEGPALESSARYYWRVQVWDASGQTSPWSAAALWEMGLLDAADWLAQWITPDVPDVDADRTESQPAPMLRGTFEVARKIRSARAYVKSLGLYEMELNGVRVGDELFTPGWTAYRKRLQYQTYDVTEQVRVGENAIGVSLGDGWYRGFIGFEGQRNYYGDTLALLAQIRILYEDGDVQIVGTDTSWKSFTAGPIRASDIYMGEVYDARREETGFSLPDYDDSAWSDVRAVPSPEAKLFAAAGPPVRRMEEIRPIEILRTPEGDTVFDMGQNMVGWVRVNIDPRASWAGRTITLRHAEVLDSKGNFYTENLRGATQQVQFILDEDRSTYEPHFTFQGFRYVAIDGYPGEATLDSLTGIVIHSDMKVTGTFETSDKNLNQLQRNILWGQKGNFLDVPTDCPQRDERMGLDGRRSSFRAHGGVQYGRRGFLHAMARRLGRRSI